MSAAMPATSTLGGCGRRRVAVRLAFLSAVVLAVVVALAVVEVGVSLRWSSSSSGGAGAGGGGGGSLAFLADNDTGGRNGVGDGGEDGAGDGGGDGATTAVGGAESGDGPPGGGGVGAKRAYAVAFPDVRDPLVLERARALWNSLAALKSDDEEIVAIVPRYSGKQLVSPLADAGYRVLPRDTPAPPWRASGRFVQQAMAATGAGWGSQGADDDGSGGGGYSWNLLALEALSLTEYEEVVVLDQKMVVFQTVKQPSRRASTRNDGGGSSIPHEAQVPGGQTPGREGGEGEETRGQRRWRFLSGDDGGGEQRSSASTTADKLPPLLPEGDGWTIGFAAGDKSAFASGPGVNTLPQAQRELFFGQHAALMTVRPNAELYDEISHLLCKGDGLFEEAFPGNSGKSYGDRLKLDDALSAKAPTTPLLHLAVAMASPRETIAQVPLEICGGGSEATAGEVEWKWTGAALPVVWCPSSPSRKRGRRLLGQQDAELAGDRGVGSVPGAAAGSFATASLATNTSGKSGSRSDDAGRVTDFDIREDGGRRTGRDKAEESNFAPATAAAPAAVEVRGERGREKRYPAGTGRLRSLPVGRALSRERGGAHRIGRRRLDGSGGGGSGGSGDSGADGDSAQSRGGEEGAREEVKEDGGEEGEMEEERQKEEGVEEEEVKMGDSNRVGDAVRLAWIPADPCSCTDAPGAVGEACRGWLMARAAGPPSESEGGERGHVLALALSACKDGVFVSPLPLPAVPEEEAARAAAAAGASYSARRSPEGGGGGDEVLLSASPPPPPPPPLWQEVKPERKAVVTQGDLNAFQHFWVANVEHKVLMVAIPKVACTQVHALFLRLQGSENWNTQHMEEIHYHKDMDKYKLSTMPNMPPARASAILNDPTWTKGVFLRDPAERLLSCFLDKVVHRRSYSVNVFKAEEVLPFEKFVDLTSKTARARLQKDYPGGNLGLTRRSNPHWRPQLFFGLDKFLPYFDFVGDFKHVQEHSEEFLKRAGLWEEFGASGWGRWGQAAFFQRSTVRGHATGSHDSLGQYYTPALLASVREAYADTDYKLMASLGWWNETAISPLPP